MTHFVKKLILSITTLLVTINFSLSQSTCDFDAIRAAFKAKGCIELSTCFSECSMYFLNPKSMTGSEAQAFAEGLGANLVSIHSQAENDCILSALNTLGETGTIWIGLNDEEIEGTFVWYDQSTVGYTNWNSGEPNNSGGNEDCVQIYPTGSNPGKWNDLPCNIGNSKSIIKVDLCLLVNAGPDIMICDGETAVMESTPSKFGSKPYTYQWNNNGPSDYPNSVTPSKTTEYILDSYDRYNCSSADTMIVSVDDTIKPTGAITDTTVQCIDDVPKADILAVKNVADNCDTNPTVTYLGEVSDGRTCPELITRTYNIEDNYGNNIDLVQTITVNDDTAPTATGLPSISVPCFNDIPKADISILKDVIDNCTMNPVVAHESDVSDGNNCNSEVITRIYSVTDDCGNTTKITQTITVDLIAPTFTVTFTNPTTCLGSDGTITLSGLNPHTDYEVGFDGGIPSLITTNAAGEYIITGLVAGSYTDFTVVETSCSTCSTTDKTIIVLEDPNPPFINAGQDIEVCAEERIILKAINPEGANISWNKGVVDGSEFMSSIGTTTYTVTAELINCFSLDSINVTVHPLPIVSAGNDIEVCEGEKITLSGSGANTYIWDNGVTNGVSFIPNVGSTKYSVIGTTNHGCTDTDDLEVTVHPTPVVLFKANTIEGCAPIEINFKNLIGETSSSCRYTINGNLEIPGCDINYVFNSAGCYNINLEVETIHGCVNDSTAYDYICIDDLPIADFTVNPEELSIFKNTVSFNNKSIGASTYKWSFGDGQYSEEKNPFHYFSVSETDPECAYNIELLAFSELGCADTTLGTLPCFDELLYYIPNTFTPDDNQYNEIFTPVFTKGFDPLSYSLKIFNRWGQILFESNDTEYGWDGTYGIGTINKAPTGVYIWRINFKREGSGQEFEEVGQVNLLR